MRLPALRCAQHERSLHICDCSRGTCSSNCCHATARSHRCCHALEHAATPTGNWDEETLSSFRGLSKGYRFLKDGHVQVLEMHPLPDHPQFVYVRASVLPSMVKTRLYNVRVCLNNKGFIHTAYCVCPAGLGGVCNHVAAVGYALADFAEKDLRKESRLPCTSRLQKWNRPRQRNVAPRRVADIQVVKEEVWQEETAPKISP